MPQSSSILQHPGKTVVLSVLPMYAALQCDCNLYFKYIGSRSTQVMISESRAALHLCTCGNRATTDDGGATAAPTPPTPLWHWLAAAASSERSEYYMSPRLPPPRHCSAAAAARRRRRRRAYAVQYNVVTLRSEHIEYRSCPAH